MLKQIRHITLAMIIASAGFFTSEAVANPVWKDFKSLTPTSGQNFMPVERKTQARWAQRKISASQAKSIALRRVPGGEVVDISLNGNTYRVRVIRRDGRVVDVFIDAVTGRVR